MPAKRGPKVRTPETTRPKKAIAGLWESFAPPKDLNAAALCEFHRLVANLRRVGTLDATDPQIVLTAARLQVMQDEAFQVIAREGLTATGGHGSPIPHPLIAVTNSIAIRLRGLKHDMGLTASSSKHGTPAKSEDPEGEWGDLLTITG